MKMPENQYKAPSIKTNIIINTLYQILTVITPFITAPYISRVLGSDGIGVYSYTSSYQMYFSLIAALGIASYGTREIARKRNNEYERSKAFWEIQILKFLTSLLSLIGWGIFVYLNTKYKIIYIVLTMNLLSTMFDVTWFFNGMEQFKYTVTRNTIIKILEIILIFLFIKQKDDLILYIIIMSGATLLGSISIWLSLSAFLVKVPVKEFRLAHHFKETLIYFIPTIATSLYTILDKTLIGVITQDENQNGYYEQANKILGIIKALVFTSLNTVLGSRISYLFEEKKIDEIKLRIEQSMNFIFLMGFGCCFGVIAVAPNFVPIFFGAGYEPVVGLLQLLSPVIIIIGVSGCLGSQYYTPAGLRGKSSIYIITGSVVNIICNIIFIPKYASIGAAIGTLIAESVITILYLIFCNGYFTFKQILFCSWKKVIASLIMFFSIIIFGHITINALMLLVLQIILGILIYFLSLLILKDDFVITLLQKRISNKKRNSKNG
ncbi:MAG: flippase [Treponema sp.]|nr:flippase [Treponema sp.]